MPDDNSPQLGGQDHDNAPMISGRGTQIIVSARGAYQARNLDALFAALSADQQVAFQQAVIAAALPHVLSVMDHYPALQQTAPTLWRIARSTADQHGYAGQPISEVVRANDVYFDSGEPADALLRLACAVDNPYSQRRAFWDFAIGAVQAARKVLSPRYNVAFHEEIQLQLDQWLLDAAWALFQGRAVPPIPALDDEALHAILTNVPEMHRRHNMEGLIYAMDSDQQARFRSVLLDQAVAHLEYGLQREPHEPQHRQWLETFQAWLTLPSRPDDAALEAMDDALHRTRFSRLRSACYSMLGAFTGMPSNGAVGDLYRTSRAAIIVASFAAIAGRDLEADFNAPHPITEAAGDRADQWQRDTALAILTDQPIPPLGDLDSNG